MPPRKGKDGARRDVARGVRAMSAGSLGWVEAIQKIQVFFRRRRRGASSRPIYEDPSALGCQAQRPGPPSPLSSDEL